MHADPAGRAPVRVLRVITRTNVGGPALHVALLTARLADGFDTTLVAGRVAKDEAEAERVLVSHGVLPLRIPCLRRAIAPADDVRAYRALREVIRKWRPDIVHTHTAKAGALGRAAALREHVPCIVHTFHGHVFRGHLGNMASRLAIHAERRLARRTTAFVAVSPEVAHDITVRYGIAPPEHVHVIPLGVPVPDVDEQAARDRVRGALGIPVEAPVALIAGRLTAVKRPLHALSAFEHARRSVPDAHLLVAGGGELADAVRDAAGAGVHVLGWREDVPDLMAAADALLLSSEMEGSPVALIEGALLRRPAAATRVGGVPSVVVDGSTGLLADPADAAGLGAALARLLGDAALRVHLGDAARAHATARFGVEPMLAAHRALYRALGTPGV